MTVDGSLTDWTGLTLFETDPDDVTGAGNLVDWQQGLMAHSPDRFYMAFKTKNVIALNQDYNIFLDTDANGATGFRVGLIGAEYLLQGATIYHYTGDGTSWSWDAGAVATYFTAVDTVEMSFPRLALGNPVNINLVYFGTGATQDDLYPNNVFGTSVGPRYFNYTAP
jgi:hypothetical protein